jgi:hypothetical protein
MQFFKNVYDCVWQRQMEHFQLNDYNWNAWNELYDKWIIFFTIVFQKMKCCAICGIIKIKSSR